LKAIAVPLLEEVLERGLAAIRQPDGNHVAILGILGWLHHYDIAVVHHGVDHRRPMDFQREQILALLTGWHERTGDLHGFIGIQVIEIGAGYKDRLSGLDAPQDGHAEHL
jgi:hypothetical protein